uniref:SFRICE_016564 n=1 Tax=Spodoptera frugiperda TaxID=7108 RepID=A0A2H1V384_SPOFR
MLEAHIHEQHSVTHDAAIVASVECSPSLDGKCVNQVRARIAAVIRLDGACVGCDPQPLPKKIEETEGLVKICVK